MHGVADEQDLPSIEHILTDLSAKQTPLELIITEPYQRISGGFLIEPLPALQKLHTEITSALKPYLGTSDDIGIFYSKPGEIVAPESPEWVSNFPSGRDYWPHITLRVTMVEPEDYPIHFTSSRLALCHLGTRCTCRKILWETRLLSV